MSNSGWICLHRQLLDWEWYDDISVTRLFVHCLLRANHKPAKWKGIEIPAGSFITGRIKLAEETGLSEQQIRTCLKKLKSTSDLTIKSTNKNSLVTLTNWASYQERDSKVTSKMSNEQQTDNQQVTTNNNDNNETSSSKDRAAKAKRFVPPTFPEVKDYFFNKGLTDITEATKFMAYYESNGWLVGKNKMKKWQAAATGWISRSNSNGKSKQPNQQSPKPSAAERVRARAEVKRGERRSASQSLGGFGSDIRERLDNPIRGGNAGSMGNIIEGSFTEVDMGRTGSS